MKINLLIKFEFYKILVTIMHMYMHFIHKAYVTNVLYKEDSSPCKFEYQLD